jgi:hypothetical protein
MIGCDAEDTGALLVQVMVARTQVHPVPLIAVTVRPVGRVSVTVMTPVEATLELSTTVTV